MAEVLWPSLAAFGAAALMGIAAKFLSISSYFQAGMRRLLRAYLHSSGSIAIAAFFDGLDGIIFWWFLHLAQSDLVTSYTGHQLIVSAGATGVIAGVAREYVSRRFPPESWLGGWYAPLETDSDEEGADPYSQFQFVSAVRGVRAKAFRTIKKCCFEESQTYFAGRAAECDQVIRLLTFASTQPEGLMDVYGYLRNIPNSVQRYKQVRRIPKAIEKRLKEEPEATAPVELQFYWLIALVEDMKDADLVEPLRDLQPPI